MYAAGVTRISLVVGAAALMGCFHDSLRDTCEQQGNCAGATSPGSSSSATTSPPTTGEGTSASTSTSTSGDSDDVPTSGTTGAPPGAPIDGLAFRVVTIEGIDPHLYYTGLGCTDVTAFVNSELQKSILDHDANTLLVAKNYDPDAVFQEFLLYRDADCPVGEDHCLLLDTVLPVTFLAGNKDDGNCLDVELSPLNPANVEELNIPNAPCASSPPASVTLELSPNLSPINLYGGHFSAQYSPDAVDPDALVNAIFHGFVPRSDAELMTYTLMDVVINYWAAIRGSDHPESCPVPMDGMPGSVPDVDIFDLDGPEGPMEPVAGIHLYLNFTAERVKLYAPL